MIHNMYNMSVNDFKPMMSVLDGSFSAFLLMSQVIIDKTQVTNTLSLFIDDNPTQEEKRKKNLSSARGRCWLEAGRFS